MRQKQALAVMLGGASVFLTGAPGAGKTYVLNEFIQRATRVGKRVAVTASTGIAATHIGGTTIHSWSGLGIRDSLSDWDRARLAENSRLIKRFNGVDILVIDEISMLHGQRLDMINEVCKLLRANDEPFGGLQVILVGDLFQLPPVSRGNELIDFAHRSQAWSELSPKICYLSEQHRQTVIGDGLLDLLEAMRSGGVEEMHELLLQDRLGRQPDEGQIVTRLYSHNVDVDSLNQRQLRTLPGSHRTYRMQTSGRAAKVEQFVKTLLAPPDLTLAIGAEVMFVTNDFIKGFANGTRGQVIAFSGTDQPIIRLISGRELTVEPHEWSVMEDGKTTATATQLPLRLAWAITIHKSQGMSLDAATIDLSRSFTPGMGYVALSRVRSIDGIYLAGINNLALRLHPDIYEFDRELRILSMSLANITNDAADEVAQPVSAGRKPVIDEVLFEALKAWRLQRARQDKVAAFIIAHDSALEALAAYPPKTAAALRAVKGFGPKKCETYGADIMAVISMHTRA